MNKDTIIFVQFFTGCYNFIYRNKKIMEVATLLRNSFYQFNVLFAPLVAFLVSFYVLPIAVMIARKKNLVDKPSVRTSHAGSVPNLGGLSIFVGFIASAFIFVSPENFSKLQYILFGSFFMVAIGFYDDMLTISPRKKLINEFAIVATLVFFGDVRLTDLHGFFGIHEIHYLISLPLTILIMVGIINCMNLIDGIDGLASGVNFVISLFFGLYFYAIGDEPFYILCFALCGALIPFFIFNVWGVRFKLFMGDTGALLLGFLISVMAIEFNQANIIPRDDVFYLPYSPAITIGVLMLPLFDTARVFAIRIFNKKSPFRPDKNHLHHKLLELGFAHKSASAVLILLTVVFIVVAVLMRNYGFYRIVFVELFIALAFTLFIERAIRMYRLDGGRQKTRRRFL